MSEQDGGPAFPHVNATIQPDGSFVNLHDYGAVERGMSLRDYFAGQALIGVLGCRNGFLVDCGTENVPVWSFDIAEAMIAERAKRNTTDTEPPVND